MNQVDNWPYTEADVAGWPVRQFDSIDSTNRYLSDLARTESAPRRLVAVTRHQTAGRGRRGRMWDDKPGASLLLSVLFAPATLPVLSYGHAVGLAVTDACAVVAGVKVALKWPNDVLVGDRKVAGVLVETASDTSAAVAGCGINLNWAGQLPPSLQDGAISLDEAAGASIPQPEFLHGLLSALSNRLARPDWLAGAYRSRCATLGKSVRVERSGELLVGRAVDLSDDGALVVETDSGRQTVTVGDVVHLRTD